MKAVGLWVDICGGCDAAISIQSLNRNLWFTRMLTDFTHAFTGLIGNESVPILTGTATVLIPGLGWQFPKLKYKYF